MLTGKIHAAGRRVQRHIADEVILLKAPTNTRSPSRCLQVDVEQRQAMSQPRRKSLCIEVVPGLAPAGGFRRRSALAHPQATGCPHLAKLESKMAADQLLLQRRRSSASIALSGNAASLQPQTCPYHRLKDFVGSVTQTAIQIGDQLKEQLFPARERVAAGTKSFDEIPGPTGLPLFGSALDYTALGRFSPKEFDKALRERHDKYGNIFRERLMNEEFIYISDPKDIRVMVQNEGKAPCRPHLDVIERSRNQENLPVGITCMQGEEWLRNRNAINPAIAPLRTVIEFRDAQGEVTDDFVDFMKQARSEKTGEIEDFEQWVNRWALESVAVVLLNARLGLLKKTAEKKEPAAEKLRKCMDTFFDYGARLTFGMPTWKFWNTKDWKVFRQCQREEFANAGYFVDRKLQELAKNDAKSSGESTKTPSCLLEHVINNKSLTRDEAVTVCLELLAGGIDTTASATIFTLYQLANNPQHQERLRELLEADDSDHKSEFSKYLKACVWEAMRLNPLTYANMRKTNRKLVFSGYEVPAGTTVRYISHLVNLRNEKYFPSPEKFLPERWMDKKSPFRCTEQFTFTPFGHGARQCPGRRVAEQEMDLLFRSILKNFKIGYQHEKMGVKVRLFNAPDKAAKFSFVPLEK